MSTAAKGHYRKATGDPMTTENNRYPRSEASDAVELEYERSITAATQRGDDAWASELAVGLDQYRTLYKTKDGEQRG